MGKSLDVLLRSTLSYHVLISECTIVGFPTPFTCKNTFCLAGFWPVCDPLESCSKIQVRNTFFLKLQIKEASSKVISRDVFTLMHCKSCFCTGRIDIWLLILATTRKITTKIKLECDLRGLQKLISKLIFHHATTIKLLTCNFFHVKYCSLRRLLRLMRLTFPLTSLLNLTLYCANRIVWQHNFQVLFPSLLC